jgi:4'-phosphopantetheinyl transferase
LSRYVDVAPREWQFAANAYGRPELGATHASCGLRFNLSNVPDIVACVVTRGCDVGVDVEPITRMQGEHSIAERYFTADESADIRAAAPERRSERFFRYWTLKEAYIKAHGSGLSLPLDAFAMRLGDERISIAFDGRIDDRAEDWQFEQRWIDDVHVLAVAVRQALPVTLSVFDVVPLRHA